MNELIPISGESVRLWPLTPTRDARPNMGGRDRMKVR
jgi:hypothetical protein